MHTQHIEAAKQNLLKETEKSRCKGQVYNKFSTSKWFMKVAFIVRYNKDFLENDFVSQIFKMFDIDKTFQFLSIIFF